METIEAARPFVRTRWNRSLVTGVPRPAHPRLPELPGAPIVGSALVLLSSVVLAAGTVALFF